MSVEEVRKLWRLADAVCFDVDSTVCKDEGLDELAKFCGVEKEVVAWTNKAMSGGVSFREALSARLDIIQPTYCQLSQFLQNHKPLLSHKLKELVSLIKEKNRDIYLVSGGFRSIIEPVACMLDIPTQNIYANRLKFYYNGDYAGFDTDQPTSESGGKTKVVELLIKKNKYKNLIMIGDGATDMEASPPAAAFIGYGGNIVREKVKSQAKWFVTDFQDLMDELM
ncbi:phosphoserine phosphatase [Patella vulgata]|uniref:phosphoserine phosphatase n=1 Tax=Patella vulgata TaxID=6465 RepID=UPI00217FCCEB|nr:phosphoserine phosphatase [Patella vulgata]XP_050414279.1 phosphoserine phosphatase [Patella vulgata]XP_050414280.1 phosphoserine phosphatase [Patella vulgata]XP_050414281.1 phosphoserine phosphatase [Patella vulgata]XP_050414282.1 phosphoserine phosphatase [Patella vulgata]